MEPLSRARNRQSQSPLPLCIPDETPAITEPANWETKVSTSAWASSEPARLAAPDQNDRKATRKIRWPELPVRPEKAHPKNRHHELLTSDRRCPGGKQKKAPKMCPRK